jgi:hypothetical protein
MQIGRIIARVNSAAWCLRLTPDPQQHPATIQAANEALPSFDLQVGHLTGRLVSKLINTPKGATNSPLVS